MLLNHQNNQYFMFHQMVTWNNKSALLLKKKKISIEMLRDRLFALMYTGPHLLVLIYTSHE